MTSLLLATVAEPTAPWFGDPGLVGAMLGSVCGLLGAAYGVLVGTLARRGRGKAFIFGFHWAVLIVGILLSAAGVTALATRQPAAVWSAILLPGAVLTALMTICTPVLVRVWGRRFKAREG